MLFWLYNVIWCTCSSICYLTPVTKCCRISSDGGACGGVLTKKETNKHKLFQWITKIILNNIILTNTKSSIKSLNFTEYEHTVV